MKKYAFQGWSQGRMCPWEMHLWTNLLGVHSARKLYKQWPAPLLAHLTTLLTSGSFTIPSSGCTLGMFNKCLLPEA